MVYVVVLKMARLRTLILVKSGSVRPSILLLNRFAFSLTDFSNNLANFKLSLDGFE